MPYPLPLRSSTRRFSAREVPDAFGFRICPKSFSRDSLMSAAYSGKLERPRRRSQPIRVEARADRPRRPSARRRSSKPEASTRLTTPGRSSARASPGHLHRPARRDGRDHGTERVWQDHTSGCLSGLDAIDSGDVVIEGVSLKEMSDRERTDYRARRMGFVFQFYNLMPVLGAVEASSSLLVSRVGGGEARRRALAALELVGLGDRGTIFPTSSPEASGNG